MRSHGEREENAAGERRNEHRPQHAADPPRSRVLRPPSPSKGRHVRGKLEVGETAAKRATLPAENGGCYFVALTGGPCSGKSTATPRLRSLLEAHGYDVFVVGEVATRVIAATRTPSPGWTELEQAAFQALLLRSQLADEDAVRASAALWSRPVVVLCDRGCLDGKAFCAGRVWRAALRLAGVSETELLRRYRGVVNLECPAASSAPWAADVYEFGPGSGNPSRWHTAAQAVEAGKAGAAAWAPHPRFASVGVYPCFDDKVAAVADCVLAGLRADGWAPTL